MLGSAFASFLASLAFSFLRWYLERQAIRDDERRKIAIEGLEKINAALDWKSRNPVVVSDDVFDDFKPAKPKSDDTGSPGAQRPDKDS
jgi:hypothetical protein